jgi:hypothetical protein
MDSVAILLNISLEYFHGKKIDVELMNTEGIMAYWFIYIIIYLSIQEED